jgi:hypothetical protein
MKYKYFIIFTLIFFGFATLGISRSGIITTIILTGVLVGIGGILVHSVIKFILIECGLQSKFKGKKAK